MRSSKIALCKLKDDYFPERQSVPQILFFYSYNNTNITLKKTPRTSNKVFVGMGWQSTLFFVTLDS